MCAIRRLSINKWSSLVYRYFSCKFGRIMQTYQLLDVTMSTDSSSACQNLPKKAMIRFNHVKLIHLYFQQSVTHKREWRWNKRRSRWVQTESVRVIWETWMTAVYITLIRMRTPKKSDSYCVEKSWIHLHLKFLFVMSWRERLIIR